MINEFYIANRKYSLSFSKKGFYLIVKDNFLFKK
jgi:hypothetical protein